MTLQPASTDSLLKTIYSSTLVLMDSPCIVSSSTTELPRVNPLTPTAHSPQVVPSIPAESNDMPIFGSA